MGSEGVDGQGPPARRCEAEGQVADVRGADRTGHLEGPIAGVVVHAFGDQDAAGGVKVEGVAEDAALEVTGAEGALLQEGGGEAAFPEGGKGSGRVVAQDDDSVGEIDFERSGFKGEDATEGLPTDLV